jgi:hypothetical protein
MGDSHWLLNAAAVTGIFIALIGLFLLVNGLWILL